MHHYPPPPPPPPADSWWCITFRQQKEANCDRKLYHLLLLLLISIVFLFFLPLLPPPPPPPPLLLLSLKGRCTPHNFIIFGLCGNNLNKAEKQTKTYFTSWSHATYSSLKPEKLLAPNVVSHTSGFLKASFPSSGHFCENPSTNLRIAFSNSSFSGVSSSFPPEPSFAEVHWAALISACPILHLTYSTEE